MPEPVCKSQESGGYDSQPTANQTNKKCKPNQKTQRKGIVHVTAIVGSLQSLQRWQYFLCVTLQVWFPNYAPCRTAASRGSQLEFQKPRFGSSPCVIVRNKLMLEVYATRVDPTESLSSLHQEAKCLTMQLCSVCIVGL